MCEQAAPAVGGEIVNRDAPPAIDVSGRTMDRADIHTIRERLRDGLTDGVIMAWTDRFSRAPIEESMTIFREITTAGGHFVVAEMGMDIRPDDPHGETMLVHSLQQARVQYLQITKRWALSRGNAVKAGKAMGVPPFGYRFADPTPRAHTRGVVDSRLVADRTAPVVRELFERKATGATWLELARWLDTAAPKPNRGRWARSSVEFMIRNRTYLGEVRHGQDVHASAHEPLIPAGLWSRAQNDPGRRTPRGTYLLSGLVRCAGCGRRMQGTSGSRHAPRYGCVTAGCSNRSSITAARLDDETVRQLFRRLEEFHARAIDEADVDRAREEVDRRTGEVERLAQVVPTHPAAVAAHQKALTAAESALADAEYQLEQLARAQSQAGPDVRELERDWPSLTLNERREIVRAGVDAVLVRRASRGTSDVAGRILVVFRGDGPAELVAGRQPIRSWAWNDHPGSLRTAA